MGRRAVKRPADYEQRQNKYVIEVEEGTSLDFATIFGNNNPVHLEIGSGKGEFITQKSRIHRDINFMGVELNPKGITTILKKLDLETDINVKLLNHYVDKNINRIFNKYLI